MTRRRFVVWLPPEEYRRLASEAERDDRGVEQQASYLLRTLLRASEHEPVTGRPTEAEHVRA